MTRFTPSIAIDGDHAIIQLQWAVTRWGLVHRIPASDLECLDPIGQKRWRVPLSRVLDAVEVLIAWYGDARIDHEIWDSVAFALRPEPEVRVYLLRDDCVCLDCGSRRVAEVAA